MSLRKQTHKEKQYHITAKKINTYHMKFIVSSSYLLKQLQVLGSVINSSNTLPILDNFLFELDNNTLTVSASDLETTMSATLEIDSTSQGSVAVPAKLLLDILKTFPEQPLTFTVEENSTIEISSNSGKYAIAYAPGEEFPKSVLDDPSTTLSSCRCFSNCS
jgi:DNA polymerase-3 subunit beta